MKVIAISDLHGNLPELPSCDLLLIAGDICPGPYFPEAFAAINHIHWLNGSFRYWLAELKTKQIVGIGGNHDVLFEGRKLVDSLRLPWTYLMDETFSYEGLKIHGSPSTVPPFPEYPYEWTFQEDERGMFDRFSKIPNDVDILISHSPPYSLFDKAINNGMSVGSRSLLSRLEQLSNLKLHVFGHIHEGFGGMKIRDAMIANVAFGDEKYVPRESGWLEIEL